MSHLQSVTTPKLSVFLSYRSVEARFADVLKQRLVRDFIGLVDVFLASDTTSIPAGAKWHSEVLRGLERADLHIVVCSAFSVRCPWINYEAGAAAVREIPIVPLCHSGLVPDQLPVPLSENEGGVITDAASLQRLYQRVADRLGSDVPAVDFIQYASEFMSIQQQLEAQIGAERAAAEASGDTDTQREVITNASVVCVTSPQFEQLGYANQLDLVLSAFPGSLKHQFVRSSDELERVLLREQVDIVHIAAFVCPRAGDLYFSPVTLPLGSSAVPDPDAVSPDALISLVERSGTRLVVLGASASLVLGAQLLPVTNVIAVRDMVSAKAMASWVRTFYETLMTEPLADAFNLATRVSQAPMLLYGRQRQVPSLQMDLGRANAIVG
jgi:hypothetical protein